MRSPKGGRLLQIEKPMPLSCSWFTAAMARGVSRLSLVASVPSTSEMTSENRLKVRLH